jgi:small subunit ribosomal protein S16
MLKLRLKRNGRKRQPSYRLVIMESTSRRNGRPIDEVGYYNPITKESYLNQEKITKWLNYGVQPTETVFQLLKKSNLINVKLY